jgi:hypothetical protein
MGNETISQVSVPMINKGSRPIRLINETNCLRSTADMNPYQSQKYSCLARFILSSLLETRVGSRISVALAVLEKSNLADYWDSCSKL